MKRLAVLITSHNRKPLTLRCLRALISQELPPGMQAEIYLLDDGSQDGTSQAVAHAFPAVRILRGSGNLFWCRGMREAWRVAALEDPDFYLLLNDDTFLKPKALKTLLATWSHPHPWPESPQTEKVVVGTCQDPQTRQRSYGGQIRPGLHPGRLIPVTPTTEPSPCDTFEANLVLIPRGVTRTLGMFDDFAHAMADTDYGLRAGEHVAAREHRRDGLGLDGGRRVVALVGDGAQQPGLEPEIGEMHGGCLGADGPVKLALRDAPLRSAASACEGAVTALPFDGHTIHEAVAA